MIHGGAQSVTIWWQFMIELNNWIRNIERGCGLNQLLKQAYLNEHTTHLSFCFASFSLSLMRKEVTMVIEQSAYLGLCDAFLCEALTARKRGGWLHPPGYEQTKERTDIYVHIFTYTQADGP